MTEQSSYKGIFKSTALFSFVKVFQIVFGIVKNKVVAVLLGAEGVGIIGILSNSINLLQSGAGLGISQSAVRDISEANGINDNKRFSRIISLTKKIILFTCLFGGLVTIILSPLLSKWTFGDANYTIEYIVLALAVGLGILTEGQLAILKGMRQLRSLAKASIIGSIAGLITAVPFYYFFGKSGIVPSLIITAISAAYFSNYFVKKIKYDETRLTLREVSHEASPMVKMGVALMLVSFLGLLFNLIVSSFIRSHGGIEIVGYYSAGTTIISSYFGVVITAMTTDYYPRISAVHSDNMKLQEELNRQSEAGLILIFPLAVLFVFLSPLFIQILYSKEFSQTIQYTDYAMLGTIIIVCSNCIGMILLAKQTSSIFMLSLLGQRIVLLGIYIYLFIKYGLLGLGISYLASGVIHIILMAIIIKSKYNIQLKNRVYFHLFVVLFSTILAIYFRTIENCTIRYTLGILLFIYSCYYSYNFIKKHMGIDIIMFVKQKLRKFK